MSHLCETHNLGEQLYESTYGLPRGPHRTHTYTVTSVEYRANSSAIRRGHRTFDSTTSVSMCVTLLQDGVPYIICHPHLDGEYLPYMVRPKARRRTESVSTWLGMPVAVSPLVFPHLRPLPTFRKIMRI